MLGLAALAALPAAPASAEEPLEVAGGALRDDRGREMVLHGVNVVVGRAPWIPAAGGFEARQLRQRRSRVGQRAIGLNAIRLGIAWEGVMPAPGEVSEAYGDTGARPLSSDHGRPFASRVRTVAVPYPQRTAGRDARWSFDRADRRFTLRYRPLGGAETVVALARAAFPAGRSGAPAPTARAEMLRLRARDGVRTVR